MIQLKIPQRLKCYGLPRKIALNAEYLKKSTGLYFSRKSKVSFANSYKKVFGLLSIREANDDEDPRIPGLVSDWIEASGVYWKESAVVDYLKKIYASENIVENPRRAEGYATGIS